MDNIDIEQKFLELLDYKVSRVPNSNRYLIFDKFNKYVGFIQRKKIYKKNKKKGLDEIFGYQTYIDSDDIIYNSTRRIDSDNDYNYLFTVKGQQGNFSVNINIGKNPSLDIFGSKYEHFIFSIENQKFYFTFNSSSGKFYFNETVIVELASSDDLNSNYSYTLNFSKKEDALINWKNFNTMMLEANEIPKIYLWDDRNLEIKQSLFEDNKCISDDEVSTSGSIEEVIEKHNIAILSFSHFRYLVNKILPFKDEVITSIIEQRGLDEKEFKLFIPDYKLNNCKEIGKKLYK